MNRIVKGALVAVLFAGAFLADKWNSYDSPADQLVKRIWVEQVTGDLKAIAHMWVCGDDILKHLMPAGNCEALIAEIRRKH